jgi:predicted RNase H-like HicB family nuclease
MLRRSREGSPEDDEPEAIPEPEHVSGEHDVNISMEVDETGREIWYAKDPRVPGSHSIGKSAEEAVDGLEDRRREYRDMLHKSRGKRKRREKKNG